MNDLDPDEALFLGQARRGLNPTGADRKRLAQALAAQLALPAAPRALPRRLPSRPRVGALRAAHWVGLAGFVALGGALGYVQGYRSGVKQREVVTVVRSVPVAAPIALHAASPSEPVALPAPSEVRAATTPSAARSTQSSSSASARVPVAAALPVPALGLDEEVRQLRRIEKAVRESNPRFALVLLDELDTAIPQGQLLEERKAASVMANCQLDAPAAQADARAFLTLHARSAYVSRVREICRLPADSSTDLSSAGDK